jgi:hypothetical protein
MVAMFRPSRLRVIYRLGLFASLAMGTSCGRQKHTDDIFADARGAIPQDVDVQAAIGNLPFSCALPRLGVVTVTVSASVMPLGFRTDATATDSVWSPNLVSDIATSSGNLYVLDGVQQTLTQFDAGLHIVRTAGRKGAGPGEFTQAAAVTVDSVGNVIVADPGLARATRLDSSLRVGGFARLPPISGLQSMAVGSDGAVWVTRMIIPETVARGHGNGVVLARMATGDSALHTVLDVGSDRNAAGELLRLPGPNRLRVTTSGGYVLLIAPAAGVVNIYRDGTMQGRATACMPPALDAAYTAQLDAYAQGRSSRSQQMQPLVTDALVRGDTLYLVGPLPDSAGYFHVDRFSVTGHLIGSVMGNLNGEHLTRDVRFWERPDRLIAFGMQGTLLRVDLTQASVSQ